MRRCCDRGDTYNYSVQHQSKMFRPCGAGHLRVWIHFFSTRSQMVNDLMLCGGNEINSRTCILKSRVPLWSCWEECMSTASFLIGTFDIIEVPLKPLQYFAFGLTNILFPTCSAGNTVDQIGASACDVFHAWEYLACYFAGDGPSFVQ